MEFLPVTWDEVHKLSLMLVRKVIESRYLPDVIVGILRGGYIVARIVADILNIEELGVVEVKFYRSIGERAERPVITQPLILDVRDKNVLIVDDVVDSGRTLEIVSQQVRLRGAKNIKSAALFVKPRSIINPDYYIIKTTKWVLFPWELGELFRELNIDDLENALELIKIINYSIDEDVVKSVIELLNVIKHQEINVPGSKVR